MKASNFESFEAARRAIARNRVDAARELLNSLSDPGSAESLGISGMLERHAGDNARAIRLLRDAVSRDPLHAPLYHELGNALQDGGHLNRAINAYQKALRLRPDTAEVLNDLGTAYHAKADHGEAERCFRDAVRLDPENYSAHENLGSTLRARGAFRDARRALQRALWLRLSRPLRRWLRRRPAAAGASSDTGAQEEYLRALEAYTAGRPEDAVTHARAALRVRPDSAEALHLCGAALGELRRHQEALPLLERAVELEPKVPEFHNVLGNVLKSLGERRAAVDHYEQALSLNPEFALAHCNIASVYLEIQDYSVGLQAATRCVEVDPDLALGQLNLGLALHGLGRYGEAEKAFRRAIELQPEIQRGYCVLAQTLREQGRLDEAELALQRALALEPDDYMVHLTAGAFYHECKAQLTTARSFNKRALDLAPQEAGAHFNEALLDLQSGDFSENAWRKYEWRKKRLERDLAYKKIPLPEWRGEALGKKRLLLYGEQGIGDEIMFASIIPDAQRAVGELTIGCDPRLAPLFARSFSSARVVPWNRTHLADSAPEMRAAEVACAFGSLGQFFRRGAQTFPRHAGYLVPDPAKVATWRERLGAIGPGLKVGFAWRGGTPNSGQGRRSIPMQDLIDALSVQGVSLVPLQRDPSDEERAAFAKRAGAAAFWPEAATDVDETAALIGALDVVVSVCSWIVHLGGALGRPILVPTPLVPEWRYGQSGESMIWYPSVRLLRQRAFAEWAPVLALLRQELERRK